jgi:hypothetical protein
MKEKLTVGKTDFYAGTVHVDALFNESWKGSEGDVFSYELIELDGYYVVRVQIPYERDTKYTCFTNLKDAKSYLEMFGIEFNDAG